MNIEYPAHSLLKSTKTTYIKSLNRVSRLGIELYHHHQNIIIYVICITIFLGQNESSQPEKKSTIADINQQKSVKGPLDNLELLVELFPNVEKTSLIDSLLSSHGKYQT